MSSPSQPLTFQTSGYSRLLWPVALLLGVALAAGSLSYTPVGRINVLWIWLIWAGLPLLGSLVCLWAIFFGGERPWLFRWGSRTLHWHPSPRQRLEMLAILQRLWRALALGMLLGYWCLLLFTDLAFGWSSTLIDDSQVITSLAQSLAWPWQGFWPGAVPNAELVAATRYVRIDPGLGDSQLQLAGSWWKFLMASLICYNYLPRLLLSGVIVWRLRNVNDQTLKVRGPQESSSQAGGSNPLSAKEDLLTNWSNAPTIHWELDDTASVNSAAANIESAAANLGKASWDEDEAAMKQLLMQRPTQLLWQVNASRSPVAELADLMTMARAAGVRDQALFALTNTNTDPARHIASWKTFAEQQQLVWLKESS